MTCYGYINELEILLIEYGILFAIMTIVSYYIFKRIRFYDILILAMFVFLILHPLFKIIYLIAKINVVYYLIKYDKYPETK